jgi:integrase
VKPKQLRDSFGSWLLTLGVSLAYISKQLGHGSVSVTERHYTATSTHRNIATR